MFKEVVDEIDASLGAITEGEEFQATTLPLLTQAAQRLTTVRAGRCQEEKKDLEDDNIALCRLFESFKRLFVCVGFSPK